MTICVGNGWDISGWRTGHLRHHSYYRGSGWLSIKLPMLVDSQWLKTVTELILIIKWSHTSQFYQANDIRKYLIQADVMQYSLRIDSLRIELDVLSYWHFRPTVNISIITDSSGIMNISSSSCYTKLTEAKIFVFFRIKIVRSVISEVQTIIFLIIQK